MKNVWFFALLSLVLAAAKCSENEKNDPPPADLKGAEWRLVSIQNDALPASVEATLKIENDAAGGSGGCNRFGGTVLVDGSKLTISQVFSTKMYCEQSQQWEDRYLRALEKSEKFSIVGSALTISTADGELKFVKK